MNLNSFEGKILEEAYKFCIQNLSATQGYLNPDKFSSESNKSVVSQNNLIIALLVSLHHKLDKISSKEIIQTSDIDKLVGDFSKLSTTFEKKIAPKVKNNFLVYKENGK